MTKAEIVTATGIACLIAAAVLVAIATVSDVARLHTRLDNIEQGRIKATSKRFTSDDAADLMACLRIPYALRDECLTGIEARIEQRGHQ